MSESPPDIDMTYYVFMHQCEQPWPGFFECRAFRLAGPASRLSIETFVGSYDGFSYPREPLEIRHGSDVVWTNDIIPFCKRTTERTPP